MPPDPPLPAAAETVLTFLESVGRRSEAELYLGLFRKLPRESFALITVGGPVVRDVAGALAEQLHFLADLGLFAPLVLGLFDPETAGPHVDRLLKRLAGAGLDAVLHDAAQESLVETVKGELYADRFPIVVFGTGTTLDERILRLGSLARALDSRKLVFLRRRGGLGGPTERPIELGPGHVLEIDHGTINVINLRTDRQALLAAKKLRKDDAELLELVRALLEPDDAAAPRAGLLVSVASPLNLLKELFTVKGAGTLIKGGSTIERFTSWDGLDRERLRALIETSFGRALSPSFFERAPLAVYIEASYRGALVLHRAPVSLAKPATAQEPTATFLSKFAVEPVARGEGIGQDLWQEMVREHPALYWRSRPDNPISVFYQRVCDGLQRLPEWTVYWRGVPPFVVPALVSDAVSRPRDFGD